MWLEPCESGGKEEEKRQWGVAGKAFQAVPRTVASEMQRDPTKEL